MREVRAAGWMASLPGRARHCGRPSGIDGKAILCAGLTPGDHRAVWPKASARESHRQQLVSITGKPSARNGPVSPGVIERWEGLRRLLPEPTPSPRLWAPEPGATPARLCEHTIWVRSEPAK